MNKFIFKPAQRKRLDASSKLCWISVSRVMPLFGNVSEHQMLERSPTARVFIVNDVHGDAGIH